MKEYKVGDRITLEVKPSRGCEGCFFQSFHGDCFTLCYNSDNKGIVFAEVDEEHPE